MASETNDKQPLSPEDPPSWRDSADTLHAVTGFDPMRPLSHYRILGELGRGGMGIVHLAEDTRLGRLVALKVLPPDAARNEAALQNFEREARHLARLNHPNIATIHSLEEANGIRFLTMERIEGETLSQRIARGALELDEFLAVSRQIAAAFQAAHQRGIIHRDLKPQNVMIDSEDRVKILDFGLAAVPGVHEAAGTPGYMSPEQLRSQPIDARADIWAFGCTLFECLCARPAFPGDTLSDRVHRSLSEEPDWSALPAETPPLVRALLASCLEKDAAQRASDISELRRQLEDLLAHRSMMRIAGPGAPTEPLTNLPHPISRFVGRGTLSREVRSLFNQHRLVTLTGFGGTGKTRLAIEVGRTLLPSYPGGIWIAELAALSDPSLVPEAVVRAMGVSAVPNQSAIDAIRGRVQSPTLLILDNCEHLVPACARLVSELISACDALKILATSRSPLSIGGERLVSVPPLSLPAGPSADTASHSEAVELFLDRAQLARPEFELNAQNADAVFRICRQLDGIAFAIELAAARLRVLPVEGIAARLEDRFRLLRGNDPTATPHHQTLQALVDWSFDQLNEVERTFLCRLSVFAGGWTLEAAEAICSGSPVEEWQVLDHLSVLTERSLLDFDRGIAERTGRARFRMLETVRAYGVQKLEASGELKNAQARHALWYAQQVKPGAPKGDPGAWYDLLETDHDNVRAALTWHLEASRPGLDPSAPLLFVRSLNTFWQARGHHREARLWMERALAADAVTPETLIRATVLQSHGNICFLISDYDAAVRSYEEAVILFQQHGDRAGEAGVRNNLGSVALYRSNFDEARWQYETSFRVARELGDRSRQINGLTSLGILEVEVGRYDTAVQYLEEARDLSRQLGEGMQEATALSNLGLVHTRAEHIETGRDYLQAAVAKYREVGNNHQAALAQLSLAEACSALEDMDGAEENVRSATLVLKDFGRTRTAALILRVAARLCAKRARTAASLTLYAAYAALSEALGIDLILQPAAREVEQQAIASLRARLSESEAEYAWSRGSAFEWEEAWPFVLASLSPGARV